MAKVRCEVCGREGNWWEFVGWTGKRVCRNCKETLKELWIIEHN